MPIVALVLSAVSFVSVGVSSPSIVGMYVGVIAFGAVVFALVQRRRASLTATSTGGSSS